MHGIARLLTSASLWPVVSKVQQKIGKKKKMLKYRTIEGGVIPCEAHTEWSPLAHDKFFENKKHIE